MKGLIDCRWLICVNGNGIPVERGFNRICKVFAATNIYIIEHLIVNKSQL